MAPPVETARTWHSRPRRIPSRHAGSVPGQSETGTAWLQQVVHPVGENRVGETGAPCVIFLKIGLSGV